MTRKGRAPMFDAAAMPTLAGMPPHLTLNDVYGWEPLQPNSPDYLPSGTVMRAVELKAKPFGSFEPEDIRFLVGQKIGVEILLDRALELLNPDPLVAIEYYDGDLLCDVLRAVLQPGPDHVQADPARAARILALAERALDEARTTPKYEWPRAMDSTRAEIEAGVKALRVRVGRAG
jgi:hypothetical protein